MSLPALLNLLLPHLDPRTSDQIERDVDDEFEFHLASIESELVAAGDSPEQARHAAAERFGDTEKYRRQCRRIAMEDRIMLQRMNAVLMMIVLLAVIGVSVQMYFTQRDNSLALANIATELASMKVETIDARAGMIQTASSPDRNDGASVVYVDGCIRRPGVYALPAAGQLRLVQLLTAAGDLTASSARVMVMRSIDGKPIRVFDQTVSDSSEIIDGDLKLERDDVVFVDEERAPSTGDVIHEAAPSPSDHG